jgi:hypothetical protein
MLVESIKLRAAVGIEEVKDMNDKLANLAIRNNVALCAEVCQTHGVDSIERSGFWFTLAPPPPYYPNLITTDASVTADEVLSTLEGVRGASVKDSFATLDLTPHGFALLFAAQWIYRVADRSETEPAIRWRVVSTEEEWDAWRALHGTADSLRPELLKLSNFTMFMAEDGQGGMAGALANLSEAAVGVSNIFSVGLKPLAAWRDLAAVVGRMFPGRAMVGYEGGEDLEAAAHAGFEAIGPLRVWVRNP